MDTSSPANSLFQRRTGASSLGSTADTIILITLAGAALAAGAIASYYGSMLLGLTVAAALLGIGTFAVMTARGSTLSRITLALCLSGMVALHIQLGRGTLEFHFGVFVTLALLLIYRDWRPIVASAAFFAVHHVVFDRLQAGGYGVYCTPEPNFLKIVMHASYVVVQTGLEVFVAVKMRAVSVEGEELEQLVKAVDTEGAVMLDLNHIAVTSAGAQGLKHAIGRMHAAMTEVQALMTDLIAYIAHPPEVLEHANAQHARLLAAIRAHDPGQALSVMSDHLRGTEHVLAGLLPGGRSRPTTSPLTRGRSPT